MFLLGDRSYKQQSELKDYNEEVELSFSKEGIFLPLAICNFRLRSQSGMFMAYNIYARPNEGVDYNYLDLENIQKFYLNKAENMKSVKDTKVSPFLYKIIIDRNKCEEIARWLEMLGVSKERIYPELSNIGERIKGNK